MAVNRRVRFSVTTAGLQVIVQSCIFTKYVINKFCGTSAIASTYALLFKVEQGGNSPPLKIALPPEKGYDYYMHRGTGKLCYNNNYYGKPP